MIKGLLILLLLGGAVALYFFTGAETRKEYAAKAEKQITTGADRLKSEATNLASSDEAQKIREELRDTGKVVRRNAENFGRIVEDATSDARVTTKIKGKLALDDKLSALKISVNTTAGMVTLSGQVSSAEEIERAIRLALDTEGVREVVSTLQLPGGGENNVQRANSQKTQ
jgi:osmotically-inducible protein OsmY